MLTIKSKKTPLQTHSKFCAVENIVLLSSKDLRQQMSTKRLVLERGF